MAGAVDREIAVLGGAHRTLVSTTAAALLVGVVSLLAATAPLTTANEQLAEKSHKLKTANEDLLDKTEKTQEANRKLEEQLYDNRIAVAERELTLRQDVGLATDLLKLCPEPMRGWEWDYLMRLRDGGRHRLVGHTGGLWTAVFSPDGKHIATASIDGTAKIWDVKSGKEVFVYRGHALPLAPLIPVTCLAYSPDGKHIASASLLPDVADFFKTGKFDAPRPSAA